MSDEAYTAVREASSADADALALIGSATFLETFAGVLAGHAIVAHCAANHSAQTYTRSLGSGGRAWLVEIEPGAAPVGFALLGAPDLPGALTNDIELKRIYVLSRFHGSGIGAVLMRSVMQATTGFERLLLGVYAGNARAQAFYRKNGFVEIGRRQFDVGGTSYDDIVFARALAA